MTRSVTLLAFAVTVAVLSPARAQGLKAIAPLSGYQCMMLNFSADQMRNSPLTVPVFNGPSETSGKAGLASGIMIVRSPTNVVNGFTEILFFDGRQLWMKANMLEPYKSASNPDAHCTPSMMSNGKPGFG